MNIAAIGGCHTVGFPEGIPSYISFMSQKLSRDGIVHSCSTLGNLAMKNMDSIDSFVAPQQPDVLIVQLGNYEYSADILKKLRKRMGISKSSTRANFLMVAHALSTNEPYRVFRPSTSQKLKLVWKQLIMALFGKIIVDGEEIAMRVKHLFSWLAEQRSSKVIILGLFPSLDRSVHQLREKGAFLFKELALTHGFEFIDVMSLVGQENEFFFDTIHLNAYGHELVGREVARMVRNYADSEKTGEPALNSRRRSNTPLGPGMTVPEARKL